MIQSEVQILNGIIQTYKAGFAFGSPYLLLRIHKVRHIYNHLLSVEI